MNALVVNYLDFVPNKMVNGSEDKNNCIYIFTRRNKKNTRVCKKPQKMLGGIFENPTQKNHFLFQPAQETSYRADTLGIINFVLQRLEIGFYKIDFEERGIYN